MNNDERIRALDEVEAIQEELVNFNPEAECTIRMQESLNTLRTLLSSEEVDADPEAEDKSPDSDFMETDESGNSDETIDLPTEDEKTEGSEEATDDPGLGALVNGEENKPASMLDE